MICGEHCSDAFSLCQDMPRGRMTPYHQTQRCLKNSDLYVEFLTKHSNQTGQSVVAGCLHDQRFRYSVADIAVCKAREPDSNEKLCKTGEFPAVISNFDRGRTEG